MEKEKECNRALEDPWGAVGVLIAQKRPYAKTGALPDQTRESKPASNFPATTLQRKGGADIYSRQNRNAPPRPPVGGREGGGSIVPSSGISKSTIGTSGLSEGRRPKGTRGSKMGPIV
jgi:hypothetical protein